MNVKNIQHPGTILSLKFCKNIDILSKFTILSPDDLSATRTDSNRRYVTGVTGVIEKGGVRRVIQVHREELNFEVAAHQ